MRTTSSCALALSAARPKTAAVSTAISPLFIFILCFPMSKIDRCWHLMAPALRPFPLPAVRGKESLTAFGARTIEDFFRHSLLLDASLMQEYHLTGDFPGKGHLVRNDDHRTPFPRQLLHHA